MNLPSDQTIAWVNELLPGASPTGACAMGMATVACSQARVHPTRYLLEEMRASASLEAAAARLEDWLDTVRALKKRKTRGGKA